VSPRAEKTVYLTFWSRGQLLGQRATPLLPSSSFPRPPPRPRAPLRSWAVHRPGPPRQPHERPSPAPFRRPPGKDATAHRWDHLPMVVFRYAPRILLQTRLEFRQTQGCHDGLLRRRAGTNPSEPRRGPSLPKCVLERCSTILRMLCNFRIFAVTSPRAAGTSFRTSTPSPPRAFLCLKSHARLHVPLVSFSRPCSKLFWPAPVAPYEASNLFAAGDTPEPLYCPLLRMLDSS
jgi:hypothetical protein